MKSVSSTLAILPLAVCTSAVAYSTEGVPGSRRAFLCSIPPCAAGLAFGLFINVNHEASCVCGSCSSRIGPMGVSAKDFSETDNNKNISLSPDFYAQDLEAQRTLSRLEKKGFLLDTDEERTMRLNDALSSFSYESVTNSKKIKSGTRVNANAQKLDTKAKIIEQK